MALQYEIFRVPVQRFKPAVGSFSFRTNDTRLLV
jgi:hypothetical protein